MKLAYASLAVFLCAVVAVVAILGFLAEKADPFEILRSYTVSDNTMYLVSKNASTREDQYYADRTVNLTFDTVRQADERLDLAFSHRNGWSLAHAGESYEHAQRGQQNVDIFRDQGDVELIEHRDLNSVQVFGLKVSQNKFSRIRQKE